MVTRGRVLAIAFGLVLAMAHATSRAADAPAVDVIRKREAATIVTAPGELGAVGTLARDRLAAYLERLTGSRPVLRNAPDDGATRAIILGGPATARRYDTPEPQADRDESFTVAPVAAGLVVSGRTDAGVKRGVYWLMARLTPQPDGRVTVDGTPVQSAPWLRRRATHIGGYTHQVFDRADGRRLPKGADAATAEQLDWNLVARWDPQRLADYVRLLDFMGYNGIETPPGLYLDGRGDAATAERRWVALRREVERDGMFSGVKVDGTLAGGHGAVPYGADAAERYEAYYRRLAEAAGPVSDFVLTHWVDAGGWTGDAAHPCTIELLQDLHAKIDAEFRRVNPRIESVLSLWNLDNPNYQRWLGYRGVGTILSGGRVPPADGIAMSGRYRPDEAAAIRAAGRPAAIWAWYTADNELLYTMHVHTHALKAYFAKTPPAAGDELSMLVMDNCQRETNLYTMYVAARMMWDPTGDPETYLREAARLVFGPRLEEPAFRALKAIADVRCGGPKCQASWTAGTSDNGNGVVTFAQGYAQAQEAWVGLKDAEVDPSYLPPVTFHRPIGTLLAELKGHTEAVATYMQFLKDKRDGKRPATEVPPAPGPFEYYERLRYLREK